MEMQAVLPIQSASAHSHTFQEYDSAIFEIIGVVIANGSDDDGRAKFEAARAIRAHCERDEILARTVTWYLVDDIADALVDVIADRCNICAILDVVATFANIFIARLFATASASIARELSKQFGDLLDGVDDLRGRIALCVSFENLTLARGFAGIKCVGARI